MIRNILFSLLWIGSMVNAQVGISNNPNFVPHQSAALHIDSEDKVVLIPRVQLTSENDMSFIPNATDGLMIYNTNQTDELSKGFYYWSKNHWNLLGNDESDIKIVNVEGTKTNLLGYNPEGYGASAPNTVTIDSYTFTKIGCEKWETNGHYYCGYTSKKTTSNKNDYSPTNWNVAYKAAKKMGAYLVTITNEAEWNFILDRIYNNQRYRIFSENDVNRRVWLGQNKLKLPGNPNEFLWITGEVSQMNWETGYYFSNFDSNEPNNENEVEGCSHIWHAPGGTKLTWNDTLCTLVTDLNGTHASTSPIFHIFEFVQ